MATWPSNQTPDQWPTTGAVPSRPAHDTTTTAAYDPSTVASRAAAEFDATAPTSARLPYLTNLAWSAEQPEFASPLPIERRRRWFMHSGVLAFAGGGLVAAAAAGLFGALHGAHSASVDTSSHSAPSPAPAAAPTNPASTPAHPDEAGHADPLGDGQARILWFHQPSDNAPTLDVVFIGAAHQ